VTEMIQSSDTRPHHPLNPYAEHNWAWA